MRLLLDTHLLLWAAGEPERLSPLARGLLSEPRNELIFSTASIWEASVKQSLRRSDFQVDPTALRSGLLDNGYSELSIEGLHTLAVAALPALHKDPFDRMLIAQAIVEGLTLLTVDAVVAQYPGPIRKV